MERQGLHAARQRGADGVAWRCGGSSPSRRRARDGGLCGGVSSCCGGAPRGPRRRGRAGDAGAQPGGEDGGGATRAREKRARKKERTERKTAGGFKNIIFGGYVRGPPKITLFSSAASDAAGNSVIFDGLLGPPKIATYFRRPGSSRRK
jgi:hypothetical protein